MNREEMVLPIMNSPRSGECGYKWWFLVLTKEMEIYHLHCLES